jgi:hypothetical protein
VSWLNNNPTASGYKLFRGITGDISSRAFLPPNHPSSSNNYLDLTVQDGTSYNYWLKSYNTVYHPPNTEITSYDENGNPTGFIDHPGYYEDVESAFSGRSISVTPQLCQSAPVTTPVVTPTVQLTITTPDGTFPDNDLPINVRQNDPVTINWQITNATDATASSNPVLNSWNGPVNPVTGSANISTATIGSFLLSLIGINDSANATSSIQINVKSATDAFIKTTQGDVHSNNNINVPD